MQDTAVVSYHRNGVGGEPYYVIALDGGKESPARMIAIVPVVAVRDENDRLRPVDSHIPEILVIDPSECEAFAYGDGTMQNWRGADYWSQAVMEALHEDEL